MSQSTVIIPNKEFFEGVSEQLLTHQRLLIPIKGRSMLPFLRPGRDKVVLQNNQLTTLKKGMLVLCQLGPGHYCLHRIISTTPNGYVLLGDGNVGNTEQVAFNQVIAWVSGVYRGHKWVPYKSFIWGCYKNLWPRNPYLRKILLKIDRKLMVL